MRFCVGGVLVLIVSVVTGQGTRGGEHVATCSSWQDQRLKQLAEELAESKTLLSIDYQTISHLEQLQTWEARMINTMQQNLDVIDDVSDDVQDIDPAPSPLLPCANEDNIRLVNGSSSSEGRVEVKIGDTWMTVCEDRWTQQSAKLVCSMLGHPGSDVVAVGGAVFGDGDGSAVLPSSGTCSRSAGVICGVGDAHKIRLVNGSHPHEGRVELYMGGEWGTIAATRDWDWRDAQVVCNMLGYGGSGATPVGGGLFGVGDGPVWTQSLKCQGTESHLLWCPTSWLAGGGGRQRPPSHTLDAGVICGNWMF
ncbi:hypothetical protein BaRGS_00039401, partial [Batillaria attramentaria]